MKEKCKNCLEYHRCRETSVSNIFFLIGLIATFAVRAVTILGDINPIYGKVSWYIGVVGFFLFFLYKYKIENSRASLIVERGIKEKINSGSNLSAEDYNLLSSILCALTSKKDRINYFFIFVSSLVAILIAIYFDFLK